eukprot:symbB.v1.2.023733.t1/scaffold2195.1/size86141/5
MSSFWSPLAENTLWEYPRPTLGGERRSCADRDRVVSDRRSACSSGLRIPLGLTLLCGLRRQNIKRCGVSASRGNAGFAISEKEPKTKRYGPKEGFAPEKRLRSWLKELGAQGLDLIELGSKSGVWLKLKLRESQMEKLSPGQKFLKIPKQAWITVAATEDADVEESLAAELLKERAKGSKSKFEAYIDFLWQRDLAHHPIFWTEEEGIGLRYIAECDVILDIACMSRVHSPVRRAIYVYK